MIKHFKKNGHFGIDVSAPSKTVDGAGSIAIEVEDYGDLQNLDTVIMAYRIFDLPEVLYIVKALLEANLALIDGSAPSYRFSKGKEAGCPWSVNIDRPANTVTFWMQDTIRRDAGYTEVTLNLSSTETQLMAMRLTQACSIIAEELSEREPHIQNEPDATYVTLPS